MLFKKIPDRSGYLPVSFIALAGLLLFLDARHCLTPLHTGLERAIAPIRLAVDTSHRWGKATQAAFTSHRQLLAENATLRQNQLQLMAELQTKRALETENRRLYRLLAGSPARHATIPATSRFLLAHLIAARAAPGIAEATLNRGQQAGAQTHQVVLDAEGVMGQIIEVGLQSARIMLLSDARSTVPAEIARTGLRGMVIGQGPGLPLNLTVISSTADVQPGDQVISSGLGGRYPRGYPLGYVHRVQNTPSGSFLSIQITPAAHLDSNPPVLVLQNTRIEAS